MHIHSQTTVNLDKQHTHRHNNVIIRFEEKYTAYKYAWLQKQNNKTEKEDMYI